MFRHDAHLLACHGIRGLFLQLFGDVALVLLRGDGRRRLRLLQLEPELLHPPAQLQPFRLPDTGPQSRTSAFADV